MEAANEIDVIMKIDLLLIDNGYLKKEQLNHNNRWCGLTLCDRTGHHSIYTVIDKVISILQTNNITYQSPNYYTYSQSHGHEYVPATKAFIQILLNNTWTSISLSAYSL